MELDGPLDRRPELVQLCATQRGLVLRRIFWRDLPPSDGCGRPATILFRFHPDPDDSDFLICETRDVSLAAEPPAEQHGEWLSIG
jgi:hypothetical protein